MKLEHKPVQAEGEQFKNGMEDGILAYCSGSYPEIFFKTVKDMNTSLHRSKVRTHVKCVLIDNHPTPIEEGDWVIEGKVVYSDEFEKNWKKKVGRPPKNEERAKD